MSSPSSSSSYDSSLLVIAALLAVVLALTVAIHFILRLVARLTFSDSTNSSTSIISNNSSNVVDPPPHKSLVDTLPLFTLSSLPASPSATCSICLSRFLSSDKLRFLPACLHAFHSPCIDTWLKSSPSCPLCRSTVQCDVYVQPMQEGESTTPASADAEEITEDNAGFWLKEYVDRLVVSASSSFNSMRFSNWGSNGRLDEGGRGSLELGESFENEDLGSGYFASSFKWIMAAVNSQDSESLSQQLIHVFSVFLFIL